MRIYVDTTIAPFVAMETLENLINAGCTLVFANTAVDVSLLRDNPEWTEQMLKNGNIVVEFWLTLDQMTAKPFYWSSAEVETPACASFEEAIGYLPNPDAMRHLADLVNKYGIPKGEWPMGKWEPPAPILAEDAEALGIDPATATRTDIFLAAKNTGNLLDVYSRYNVGYSTGLARQHMCPGILNTNGTISVISIK